MARIINYLLLQTGLTENDFLIKASQAAIHSLLLSNNIRRDTTLNIYWLEKNTKITINGATIRNLRPDQESTMGVIKALIKKSKYTRERPRQAIEQPCITVSDKPVIINGKTLVENNGFTILDPLDAPPEYCRTSFKIPLITNPIEAIILSNMVMDLCMKNRICSSTKQ